MGRGILFNIRNFPGRAARTYATRGDYGGCVSARVSRLGSHAARGGRVAVARLASMRAQREVQLALRNSYYICAAPQILFIYMAAAPCAAGGLLIKVSRRRGQ